MKPIYIYNTKARKNRYIPIFFLCEIILPLLGLISIFKSWYILTVILAMIWLYAASRFLATDTSGRLPDHDLDRYELTKGTVSNRFVKRKAGTGYYYGGRSQFMEFKSVFLVDPTRPERPAYICRYKIDNKIADHEVIAFCNQMELHMNQKLFDSLPAHSYNHMHYDVEH